MKKTGTDVAPKRERVPQAERRRVTRGKLLDATIESLIDIGYPRTTTVEVGQRAGLSRGAQLHHFPSRADLLFGAIEHLADERSKEFETELNSRLQKGDDPFDAMVDMLWATFSGPLYWAVVELMVAARTDPELLERFEAFERSLGGRIYAAFKQLTGRGDREARVAVEMTLYFMRGLAMERIFRENDAHYDDLVERWKKSLRTMLS
ncbi:MAG: TetR/AcrR family transcriptional regulator [Deltaproteobacteria bacterium]|nr:TetR/AcrR family transcriptional regulator [Deltaproteobacteria bacterium]